MRCTILTKQSGRRAPQPHSTAITALWGMLWSHTEVHCIPQLFPPEADLLAILPLPLYLLNVLLKEGEKKLA